MVGHQGDAKGEMASQLFRRRVATETYAHRVSKRSLNSQISGAKLPRDLGGGVL